MLNFTCSLPTKIFFGRNTVDKVGTALKKNKASSVLICHGSDRIKESGLLDRILGLLSAENIDYSILSGIEPNPRINSVREGIAITREENTDFILPVGGGSVIDCAKAIAAGHFHDGDPWELFTGTARVKNALPVGTILTLAATGSEMNGNAVISDLATNRKLGLHTRKIKPVFSILDPTLTYTVPVWHTASGIADIIVHVFEQYFSTVEGTYLQDRMSEAVITTCIHYAPIVMREPDNYEARANILWAGTIALNELLTYGRIGDWATHTIEHAISAYDDVTHGAGLAVVTPHWMRHVINDTNIGKFSALGRNIWHLDSDKMSEKETADEAISKFSSFFSSLGLPPTLRELTVREGNLSKMADSVVENGPVGNFRSLDRDDVFSILTASY